MRDYFSLHCFLPVFLLLPRNITRSCSPLLSPREEILHSPRQHSLRSPLLLHSSLVSRALFHSLFPLFQLFSPFCRQSPVVAPCLFSRQGCRPRPRPVPLSSLMPPSHSRLSEASLGLSLPALPPLLLPSSGFVSCRSESSNK